MGNATNRNIVGRNMLCAFGHLVAMCCDVLGVVGSNLTIFKFEPTTPNISQHGGQTHTTYRAERSFGRGLKQILSYNYKTKRFSFLLLLFV